MGKFWRIVVYEYSRNVFRRRFLFGLLSIPLLMVGMGLLFVLLIRNEVDTRPVGYVDRSGLLANPVSPPRPDPPDRPVEFVPYPAEQDAEAALQAEQIQAYFVLGEDYLETSQAELVSLKQPSASSAGPVSGSGARHLAGQPAGGHPGAPQRWQSPDRALCRWQPGGERERMAQPAAAFLRRVCFHDCYVYHLRVPDAGCG